MLWIFRVNKKIYNQRGFIKTKEWKLLKEKLEHLICYRHNSSCYWKNHCHLLNQTESDCAKPKWTNQTKKNPNCFIKRKAKGCVLPWVWVLGEGRQAACIHVSPDVDVHRSIGFGQLSRQRDPLSGQGRDRRPGQRQPWHASSLLKASVQESHGNIDD